MTTKKLTFHTTAFVIVFERNHSMMTQNALPRSSRIGTAS